MTKPDIINKKESYRPLFKTSKILKANDLYAQQALLFMINYEKKNLPDSFTNMFVHNRDICLNTTTRESTHINTVRQRNNFIAHLPKSMLPRLCVYYVYPYLYVKYYVYTNITVNHIHP